MSVPHELLEADLAVCRASLAHHSRTFHAASLLLPPSVRAPATVLYGFCRLADDTVDVEGGRRLAITQLRRRLDRVFEGRPQPVAADRALAAVNREADALRSIVILSSHLPDPQRRQVEALASDYARAAAREWPLLARREHSDAAARASDALLAGVTSPAIVASAPPGVVQAETGLALAIRDGRETRLSLSQTHVNPLKWLGMAFLGFLTMVSVAVVHIGAPRAMAAAVLIFALASGPTAVIVLIHGNPFQPPAAVEATPLEQFAASAGTGNNQ